MSRLWIVECKCFGNTGKGRYEFLISLYAESAEQARENATLVTREYVAIEDIREVKLTSES